MRRALTSKTQAGFSLIELMMVLVIVTILVTAAAPSFQSSIQRGRMAAGLSNIGDMLNVARSEAIVRSAFVSACVSTNGIVCGSNRWEDGWMIFVDDGAGGGTEGDGTRNGGEVVLRIGAPAKRGVTIRTSNFDDDEFITFDADGMAVSTGTFVFCDERGATQAAGLVLNVSGQSRLAVDSAGADDTVEDNTGAAVTCP
ncbi:MAG: hypothetical protein CSA53_06695 [Gammaproteobacteria bacterium]|nr:MAG: hypothetical protein CSA53_06695 [Gammaproteobacteria bacterium]